MFPELMFCEEVDNLNSYIRRIIVMSVNTRHKAHSNLTSDDGTAFAVHVTGNNRAAHLERSLCLSGKPGNVKICDRDNGKSLHKGAKMVRKVQRRTLASFLWLVSQSPLILSKVSEVREERNVVK